MTHPIVIKLHDSSLMPQLGLDVRKTGNKKVAPAIHKALEVGYCSFNTVAAYQNEASVGNALYSVDVNHDELFTTTKLWSGGRKRPHKMLRESLSKLKPDYVDLHLIRWSALVIGYYVEAWQAPIELQRQGLVKNIDVRNPQVPHLQELIDETGVALVINRIELHPLSQQCQLRARNAIYKIQTESWNPLVQGGKGVFDQKVIHQLTDKHDKTPAQIVIRWYLGNGLVAILKSVTPSCIAENFNVWDFRLDKDELGEIVELDQDKRLEPDPDQFGG